MSVNMRLSEAMRLGAMLKPQAYGYLLSNSATCALGAAAEALGVPLTRTSSGVMTRPYQWPHGVCWMFSAITGCPVCQDTWRVTVESMIVHLNDDHRWTREQIADWVETIERAQSPAAREAPARGSISALSDGETKGLP